MEEVDNIIIHSLRQIGCDIDDCTTNLGSFNTELVVDAAVRCLEIIRPGIGISRVLPINMAARFRLGATLAQTCSDLGYRGDIGYQTFLYSSEIDLRKVFIFLIEKLPKESDKEINEPISKIDELEKQVNNIMSNELSCSWLPHNSHNKKTGFIKMPYKSYDIDLPSTSTDLHFQEYYEKYQLQVPEQLIKPDYLLPSIISKCSRDKYGKPTDIIERLEWINSQAIQHTSSYVNNQEDKTMSRFTLNERLQSSEKSSFDEETKTPELINKQKSTTEERQNQEIDRIKLNCEKLKSEIEIIQNDMKKLSNQMTQLNAKQIEEEKKLELRDEEKKNKARTYDLLEDGENNFKKLETIIDAGKKKLINLANQWEKHRAPLIQKYRDEREKYSAKASTSKKKIDQLRQLREKEKELIEECKLKDHQYTQLVAEVQKLPNETNRSAYTQRILEIINNVRKQCDEIDKVLGDTREIQKEINMLTGKLERSFTVVDELIFRNAKTNEASKRAYKLLATLHSDCSELVTLVEETGTTCREIRDLEEQIDSESTKNVEANLERITADLKQMRQETASLTTQLATKNY
ncbi:hypothetical protein HCN44_010309 [Aphidius gifuensis]|uniref:Coiled-coil domain-containing protein 22 homolog n=1 Tax=Aphidius gifuensis TaxID=684658 RepID=A0A834XYX4_APHGI|nr:coiled-coil domain-containing protein 22 homolog [Aphidius gifuensis]KAF7993714.1 hypothetical protein HCN44_010309 [Aphidius gifuensis]